MKFITDLVGLIAIKEVYGEDTAKKAVDGYLQGACVGAALLILWLLFMIAYPYL